MWGDLGRAVMRGEMCEHAEALPAKEGLTPEDIDHIGGCACCQNVLAIIRAIRTIPDDEWLARFEPETPECIPEHVLVAFACGSLPAGNAEEVRRHLRDCTRCCARISKYRGMVRGGSEEPRLS
jgi:hypothetical protein